MDLSLGADAYSSAYLQRHHQQQQQQQQLLHYHQQQQQEQQHHYPYHHAQAPQQALSLAPPSGRGFLDFESLEQKGAPNSSGLGLGHLGSSFSYQPDFALSAYPAGAPDPASAAAYRPHDFVPSWSINSVSPQVGAAQTLHNSSARAPAHDLHSAAYGGGAQASLHGWGVKDPHRLQFSQHLGDNCLPPGVEPSGADPAFSYGYSQPHGRPQSYPQAALHSSLDPQGYRQWQQHAPGGAPASTRGKPPRKVFPKRKSTKSTKDSEKRNPPGKTAKTKGTGAAPNLSSEKGLGWCSVCQRDCVTAVALKQHLEGKGHKKKVERQKLQVEPAASKQSSEKNGGVSNMLEQMWMQVSSMNKPSRTETPRKKQKTEEAGQDGQPLNVMPGAEGDFTNRKRKQKAGKDVQSTAVNKPNATEEPPVPKKKEVVKVRCEHCNVDCNSQTVLEIHLGGKKHAARVKKLEEMAVASKQGETTLVSQ